MKWKKKEKLNKVPIYSWCADVEPQAMEQANNISSHPFIYHHVALMPDCHAGFGFPIGCVAAFKNFCIPNAVGVDIGCGMSAVKTDISYKKIKKDEIKAIFSHVEKTIPLGFSTHGSKQAWDDFDNFFNTFSSGKPGWMSQSNIDRAKKSLGTLGGGNHFIELLKDEDNFIWLMIHSGSRNLGKTIADFYHNKAVKYCAANKIKIPSQELAGFHADSKQGKSYLRDMSFALDFAMENRKRIMQQFKTSVNQVLNCSFTHEINIHHNYASLEKNINTDVFVHRKGATSAKLNEHGIIPGSMGTNSYIVKGLGNSDSFMSCSHGAGRTMGRNQACRNLDLNECKSIMKGIYHNDFKKISKGRLKGKYDLSEAPLAYKDINGVISSQTDLVEVLFKLSPIGSLKG